MTMNRKFKLQFLLFAVLTLAVRLDGFVLAPQQNTPELVAPSQTTTAMTTTSLAQAASPFETLKNTFFPPAEVKEEKPALPDVVIDPDFRLAGIFLVAGVLLDLIPYIQLTLGPFVTLLGVLFLVQTFRIRFVFNADSFELKIGDQLDETGENFVVGGENKWAYSSFVNYEFFPKGWVGTPQGPILVYFKETQTPSDKWNEGPGEYANSEEAIAKGATPGQVHFFPALCNAEQIKAEFEKRGCAKM